MTSGTTQPGLQVSELFKWSPSESGAAEALVGAAGLAVPVALGIAMNRPALGLVASIGSLALGGSTETVRSVRAAFVELGVLLLTALAAALTAALLAPLQTLAPFLWTMLALLAAVAGGYSRQAAVATTRYTVLMVIITSSLSAAAAPFSVLPLILGTTLWTGLLHLGVRLGRLQGRHAGANGLAPPPATAAQKWRRWRRLIKEWAGWRYPARLALGLLGAAVIQDLWPDHRYSWVALTVVLLTQRPAEGSLLRALQRTIGTAVGVLCASLLLFLHLPLGIVGACMAVLAALRLLTRDRNYLLYSAVMAPLVLLILDAAHSFSTALLIDRLAATVIGVVLVIAVERLLRPLEARP